MPHNTHNNKPLVLVDGSAYLFRAYHALPPLVTTKGEPTGAIYGVVSMLRKLLVDIDPTYIAVVFDTKEPTFRDELYPEYKAHRKETPPDLIQQFPVLVEVVKAMGLPVLQVPGVEADDVIGTLTVTASQEGWSTLVSTSDKDLAQLVNQQVTLINTMTDTLLDEQGVVKKFGVAPNQIIDYLTLMGDTSDNVPGIPKVGPKTAAKWLADYKTLDNIIAHAHEISGKVGESLRDNLEQIPLSRELVTIKLDVNLDQHIIGSHLTGLQRQEPDNTALLKFYEHLEFKRWLAELSTEKEVEKKPLDNIQHDYVAILEEHQLKDWIKKLTAVDIFAVDTETTGLDPFTAELVGISMAIDAEAVYIPLTHDYLGAPKQLDLHAVLNELKPILEDPHYKKISHNLKFDWAIFSRYGIDISHTQFDTMIESYVYNSVAGRHNMDSVAARYLNKKTITFEEVAGKGAKQITFNQVDLEQATPYAAEDADVTLKLHQFLWPEIQKNTDLKRVFEEIEIPLVMVLARMEQHGVLIDAVLLKQQSIELTKSIHELEKIIYELAGTEFNIASPKQLQEILFTKLKLPVSSKTPTGQPSTGEAVLQELALEYPLPSHILDYRSLTKLKSTYTDSLPQQIHGQTGRVHTSYQQVVTATGRLSSTEPNLQNIPIRTQEGRRIRQAFIAPTKHKIVAADYSQIELRIMAHLSADKGLCNAFSQGLDIHQATAAEVFGMSLEKVTADQRRNAKAINFGLIYGMSAFGLSKQISTDRHTAQEYMDHYFQRYPSVKTYMEETRKLAAQQGYVSTLFGRRLYLPEINSKNHLRKMASERAAINAPMQGTAADIIKIAMINIDAWLQQHPEFGHMIMQVHDELVFEIADHLVDEFIPKLQELMEGAAELRVPLLVGIGVGNNWDEAH
jgi:DNA polymerase-1